MTVDVLAGPELGHWLDAQGYSGHFTAKRIGGGQSCLTFLLRGEAWSVVLRRPPRGDLPPSAYDVRREFAVMTALHGSGAAVPVPAPLVLVEGDASPLGVPFYLMSPVDGVVVDEETAPAVGQRAAVCEALVDVLVQLHDLDVDALPLQGFGRRGGYPARQLSRMQGLWRHNRTRDLPDVERLGAWLVDHQPPEPARETLVHGDFGLHNVLFRLGDQPEVAALLDWEMSTVGDPVADLAWLLYFWRAPDDSWAGGGPTVMRQPGFSTRSQLRDRYAARRPVEHLGWYVALAGWKLAVIHEGSYRRFREGVTDHPGYRDMEWMVPEFAARAWRAARGEMDL